MVRRDVPLGTLAAQLIHAAGASSPGSLPPGTVAVALMVADEPALAALEARLRTAAIPHTSVREPDPPWSGSLMAIGIAPTADRARLRPLLGRLSLLR